MRIDALRLAPDIARNVPGAPYYALSRTVRGSQKIHRNLDFAEITAVTAGEGRLVTFEAGRVSRVEPLLPGQLYLFRPIDVHQIAGVGPAGVTACNVAFPVTPWQAFMRLAELDPGLMTSPRPPLFHFDPDDAGALTAHYRALDRFWHGPTMLDLIEFWSAMAIRFAPRSESVIAVGAPDWLLRAVEEMRDEDNLRRGMRRFVELCHVSPAHLWRTAVRFYGMTPTELLGQVRMRHATTLLSTSSESVAVIAERTGFANGSAFSKAFRRAHLVSPRDYRKHMRVSSERRPADAEGFAEPPSDSTSPDPTSADATSAAHRPPHPGELIAGIYLNQFGVSADELAIRLGVPIATLSGLLSGSDPVTPELALRLAKSLGRSAESWLAMQASHDLWLVRARGAGL